MNKQNVQTAIQKFEDVVSSEINKLIATGISRSKAVQEVQNRLTEKKEYITAKATVRAADLAEKIGISSQDALSAIAVSQQARSLRLSGLKRMDVVSALTKRMKGDINNSPRDFDHSSPLSLAPINLETPTENTQKLEILPAQSITELHSTPPPPTSIPSPFVQSSSSTSPRQRHLLKKSLSGSGSESTLPPAKMKRSRSSDRVVVVKDVEKEVGEIDMDLARLLSGLSTEINEAMRVGDRSKVALLMRQRDQLRLNKGNSKPIETEPTQSKRSRPSSRSS